MNDNPIITIRTTINAPKEKVWKYWTEPEHIKKWNNASVDWHTTTASNDLRAGGMFLSRMEAKDGSLGFDFSGIYDEVKLYETIAYTLGDARKVKINFSENENGTEVIEAFEAETTNSIEMQKTGWQAILDNFKRYTEMQKIVPHLWYDKEAKEAALFYISLFEQSKLLKTAVLHNTPSGDVEIVGFELAGQPFDAISAGPYFAFNPSISLMVACYSMEEVNEKWNALSEGGEVLMPLDEYPFSKWYGWVQDRYGLSWQLMLMDNGQTVQKITPNLLFSNAVCGKAEEAVKYYTEVFENSKIGLVSHYEDGEATSPHAKINYAAFNLEGLDFSAMDNGYEADFDFNEAFSLTVICEDQNEIDYYWNKLSAVPEAEQCGWVKDKFGVSWQIVPAAIREVMKSDDVVKIQRMHEAILNMKKIELANLNL